MIKIILPLLFSFFLGACSKTNQLLTAPFSIPVNLQKAGVALDTVFYVAEHRNYSLTLDFHYKEGDVEDRARVKNFVGDHENKSDNYGVDTPMRIQIFSVQDIVKEAHIFEIEKERLKLQSWGSGAFGKYIAHVKMKPGVYRIVFYNLKDQPALSNTPMTLTMGRNPKSTPIQ